MILSTDNKELIKEIKEYVDKCENNECDDRYKIDGCAWCYVNYLREKNKDEYFSKLRIQFKLSKEKQRD